MDARSLHDLDAVDPELADYLADLGDTALLGDLYVVTPKTGRRSHTGGIVLAAVALLGLALYLL